MIIASFNVNSVRAHLPSILGWLKTRRPDVLMLQETKCEEQAFPRLEFEDMGYNVAVKGQKSYNGVAILSTAPLEDVNGTFEGAGDQARYIDAFTHGVRAVCAYAPHGNPIGTDKFDYKLEWLRRFKERTREMAGYDEPLVIGGDFNVVRRDDMIYDAAAFADDAIMQPESREAFEALLSDGLVEACDALGVRSPYTYYSYRYRGGIDKDKGIVLDYFLLNPAAAGRLKRLGADRDAREAERASDHLPVWVELG